MDTLKSLVGTPFSYYESIEGRLSKLHGRVEEMWREGKLSRQILRQNYQRLRTYEIYHSNRIEGNSLTIGETREVVEHDKELPQKSRRDQLEAKNLLAALDFAYETALDHTRPVSQTEVRGLHTLIMKGIQSDAGIYRKTENEIWGSRYQTPDAFQVPSKMTELSDYIKRITSTENHLDASPILSAAATHAWLAQIHPFTDGNGRSARALMNLILSRNDYFACIITEDDRPRYINALEESQGSDLTPLVELVTENVEESINDNQWVSSLVTRLELSTINRVRDEYESWRNAMDHLKSEFKHTVDNLNAMKTLSSVNVKFADYGPLSIEKYTSLRDGGRAQKTWFFGLEFNRERRRERYLFDNIRPAAQRMRNRAPVVLLVRKNTDNGYEGLQYIKQSNVPNIFQIGFDLDSRKFVTFGGSGIRERNLVNLVRQFFNQVVQRDFGG